MNNIKKARKWLFAAGVGTVLFCTGSASAGQQAIMETTGLTSQPIGHYEYCQTNRSDCRIKARSMKPMVLTRERWSEMVETNAYANATVTPVTDMDYFGVPEIWSMPEAYGDCEDYALLKRRMLMEKGWPASVLLVTVVRQPNGDGHAVLTVRTDRGDFILDNLNERVMPWNKTEYRFLKRQAAAHSGKWEGIADRRNGKALVSAVGSVNQ